MTESETLSNGRVGTGELEIEEIVATPVTVPMRAPVRWSMGVERGTTRTIVEVRTKEGVVGVGETYGGQATSAALRFLAPHLKGKSCWDVDLLARIVQTYCIPYETFIAPHVFAGVEMACWDAMGRYTARPVASLLGGVFRRQIPVAAYLFYRYAGSAGEGGESSVGEMLERAARLVEENGFQVIKVKGGVCPVEAELALVSGLREQFPSAQLRYDPNAAWSVETALRVLPRMAELALEYVEDPVDQLEAMARVRQSVPVPLATNMCVIRFSDIPPSVRQGAVDVILADVHYWGGLAACRKLAGIAETFKLGLGMHSDRELGVSTAAMVHVAAATPTLVHAIDSHYHDQADDIITVPFSYESGSFALPAGPGLGVEVDHEKLDFYHRRWESEGDVNEFGDPERPDWIPILPLF